MGRRPKQPHPDDVWVPAFVNARGRKVEGHWQPPAPDADYVWIPPHFRAGVRIEGHWRPPGRKVELVETPPPKPEPNSESKPRMPLARDPSAPLTTLVKALAKAEDQRLREAERIAEEAETEEMQRSWEPEVAEAIADVETGEPNRPGFTPGDWPASEAVTHPARRRPVPSNAPTEVVPRPPETPDLVERSVFSAFWAFVQRFFGRWSVAKEKPS